MKNNIFYKLFIFVISLLYIFTYWSCSGKSENDYIMETIESISEAAEKRDVNSLLSFISAYYADEKDRTFVDIKKLVEENFNHHQGIVANILATEIVTLQIPQATVKTDAVFSSGAAKMFRKLLYFTGSCYQFNLELIKEDNIWKIKSASWEHIAIEDLLPESVDIMKEL